MTKVTTRIILMLALVAALFVSPGMSPAAAGTPLPGPACLSCSGSGDCYPCGGTGYQGDDACYLCSGTSNCATCQGRGSWQ